MNKYLKFITLSTMVLLTVGCSEEKPKNEHKGLTGFVIEANYEKERYLLQKVTKHLLQKENMVLNGIR